MLSACITLTQLSCTHYCKRWRGNVNGDDVSWRVFGWELGPASSTPFLGCEEGVLRDTLAEYVPAEAIGWQRSDFIFLIVRGCACSGLEGGSCPLWGCTVGHRLSRL